MDEVDLAGFELVEVVEVGKNDAHHGGDLVLPGDVILFESEGHHTRRGEPLIGEKGRFFSPISHGLHYALDFVVRPYHAK